KEEGDRFTEGGSGARWALARGVPEGAILTEERSRTTYQNLAGAKRLLERRDPGGGRHRIVVVSDPFHMFRAVRQAADLGMDAYPSPTRTSPLSASRLKLTALGLTALRRLQVEGGPRGPDRRRPPPGRDHADGAAGRLDPAAAVPAAGQAAV